MPAAEIFPGIRKRVLCQGSHGAMMGRTEERTTALIREFHEHTRAVVEAHQGHVVDTAGDSVFGEFDSVINAMRCAQAIQDPQAATNVGRESTERIHQQVYSLLVRHDR